MDIERFLMNLSEVKSLFDEIIDNCSNLEGVHFMIAPSIAPNTIVEGYEIHMSGKTIDEKTSSYLRDLAVINGLIFDQRGSSIDIYKAKSV